MGAAAAALLALPVAVRAAEGHADAALRGDGAVLRWLSCRANTALPRGNPVGLSRQTIRPLLDVEAEEIWIQMAHEGLFAQDGPAAWDCSPLPQGFVASAPGCQTCLWFDTQKWPNSTASSSSGPKDASLVRFHLEEGVASQECLEGSFKLEDVNAWLRRDELVHRQRYAAACIPPSVGMSRRMIRIQTTFLFLGGSVLSVFACTYRLRRPPPPAARQEAWRDPTKWREDSFPQARPQPSAPAPEGRREARPSGTQRAVASSGELDGKDRIIREIHEDLLDTADTPLADRKQVMRRHLIRWHPDKNSAEDQEVATAVLQFLNAQKKWFLAATAVPEAATLLPH